MYNLLIVWLFFGLIYKFVVFFMVYVVKDKWNIVFVKEKYIMVMEIVCREFYKILK